MVGVHWTARLVEFVFLIVLICRKHGVVVVGFAPPVPVRVGTRVASVSIEALQCSNGVPAAVTVSRTGLSPDEKMITDPWRKDILFSVGVERIIHESQSAHQHIQVEWSPILCLYVTVPPYRVKWIYGC